MNDTTSHHVLISRALRAEIEALLGELAAGDIDAANARAVRLGQHRTRDRRMLSVAEAIDLLGRLQETVRATPTIDAAAIAVQVFVDELPGKAAPRTSARFASFLLGGLGASRPVEHAVATPARTSGRARLPRPGRRR